MSKRAPDTGSGSATLLSDNPFSLKGINRRLITSLNPFYQSQRAVGPEQRRRPRQPAASATAAAAAAATAAAGGGRERQRGGLHPADPDEPLGSAAAAGDDPRPHCQRHAAVSAAVVVTVPTGGPFSFLANH
jgi:hypothetical protein